MINKFNAPIIAVFTAALLASGKLVVGFFSGSIAVLSSAADSLADIFSSLMNFIFIKKADRPPDKGHNFGHGKIEAYASLMQSIIIFLTGVFLLYKAVKKFSEPDLSISDSSAIIIMCVSIVASFFLSGFLKYTAKKENSQALYADAMHYTMDLLTNSGVLISLIAIKYTGIYWLDPLAAVLVAIYIIYSAARLHISSLKILLDAKVKDEDLRKINEVLEAFQPYAIDFHDIRTRSDGAKTFINMHVTLCNNLTLRQAHDFCDILEDEIQKVDGNIDIMIHPEPCGDKCLGIKCSRKGRLRAFINKINKKDFS